MNVKLSILYLPNSTELRPSWEANSCSSTQQITNISWNPEVHYPVQNSPPLVPILSKLNAIHILHHIVTCPRFIDEY
jgi:hypothetical protein